MTGQGRSYLDHSRDGRGQGGWYLLGLMVILLVWVIVGSVFAALLGLALGATAEGSDLTGWKSLVADLLPFSLLALAVLGTVRWVLGRPARTVVTGRPRISVGRMLYGAAVFALLLAAGTLVDSLLHPGAYRFTFDPATFVPAAIVCLLLIPVQSGAEELLFRGYVVQWTSLGTDRPHGRSLAGWQRMAVLTGVSGLVFAVPHLANPEADGAQAYAWLAWFFLGAGWAWASIVDGRIELAIGAHTANNLFSVLVAGYSGSVLPASGVWTTNVLDWPITIVTSAVAAVLFVLITGRGRRSRSETS